jgi:branched-chain amino acid transport system substrate-binding protein
VKQADEFGIVKGGQRLSTPIMAPPDIYAVGQDVCQGLVVSSFFYWYLTTETRAFAERFIAKMNKPPTEKHAASYSGVNHWLKAVTAANTVDADAVAAKMREIPVNDFFNSNIRIYDNGCVPFRTHLLEVKPVAQSKEKFDLFNVLSTLESAEANPPPGLFGCPLVKA